MLDREQRSCQQLQAFQGAGSAKTLLCNARAHTYKHTPINPHTVETCQTTRSLWKNTHKHTCTQGQETRFKGSDLCAWSRKNRKLLNSMKPMTEYTNVQRQIRKRSTQERCIRGNFLLLQLILNMCPGFYCNLLYETEKRKHADLASPFSGFIYSPLVLLQDTCFMTPQRHFSFVTYLLCHYIKEIINRWYLSWVHKIYHHTEGEFFAPSQTERGADFLSAEVQPSITSRWQLPFSTWSHIRWITGWIWLNCEAQGQKEGTLGALMPHQGGQRTWERCFYSLWPWTQIWALEGYCVHCTHGQKRKGLEDHHS